MRRLASHLGITLLALLLCGWGEALASVICPHAADPDHACCPEKTESAPAQKHAAAHATKILAQPAAAAPASPFAPRQHAPPGPAGRTHLLLSVFLI